MGLYGPGPNWSRQLYVGWTKTYTFEHNQYGNPQSELETYTPLPIVLFQTIFEYLDIDVRRNEVFYSYRFDFGHEKLKVVSVSFKLYGDSEKKIRNFLQQDEVKSNVQKKKSRVFFSESNFKIGFHCLRSDGLPKNSYDG